MDSLFKYLSEEGNIPENVKTLLKENTKLLDVKKGEILIRKGELVSKAYFVKKGCLRSYTIDEKGKEHIFMFAPENWIITDMASQVLESPSELFIDAIENSVVYVLNINKINRTEDMPPVMNTRLLKRVSVLQKRIIMLMSATALDRYKSFVNTYPNIVQRVPQKMIASYLGITPEALSKIKSKYLKSN